MKIFLETNLTPEEVIKRYEFEKGLVKIFESILNQPLYSVEEHRIIIPNLLKSIVLFNIKAGEVKSFSNLDKGDEAFLSSAFDFFRNESALLYNPVFETGTLIKDFDIVGNEGIYRGKTIDITALSIYEFCFYWLKALDDFLEEELEKDIVKVFYGGPETMFSYILNYFSFSRTSYMTEENFFKVNTDEKLKLLTKDSKVRKIINFSPEFFLEAINAMDMFFKLVKDFKNVSKLLNGEIEDAHSVRYIYKESRDGFDQTFFTVESGIERISSRKPNIKKLIEKGKKMLLSKTDEERIIAYYLNYPYFQNGKVVYGYDHPEDKRKFVTSQKNQESGFISIFHNKKKVTDSLIGSIFECYLTNKDNNIVEEDDRCIKLCFS